MVTFEKTRAFITRYSDDVQKAISCLTVAGMVAFVVFTIVSARELMTAECGVGTGGTKGKLEFWSEILFGLFFAIIAVVAWGSYKSKKEEEASQSLEDMKFPKMVRTIVMRLCLNEVPLGLVAYVFYATLASKCPQSAGSDTQAQMDTNFIDEAAYFQGYLIMSIAFALVLHIGISAVRAAEKDTGRRDLYENIMLAAEFALISGGGFVSAKHYRYTRFEEVDVAGINSTALRISCTQVGAGRDNGPEMSYATLEINNSLYVLASFAAAHFIVTVFVNIFRFKMDDGKYRKFVRTVVEPIVQAIITLMGMFCIIPLTFVLQNTPCNYAFTELIHNEEGTMGFMFLVIGYTLFVGTATLKTYREFVEPSSSTPSLGEPML